MSNWILYENSRRHERVKHKDFLIRFDPNLVQNIMIVFNLFYWFVSLISIESTFTLRESLI